MKKESGQSTIEFLLTFVFIFGIMFIYLKIAMNYTRGYMIHFANYQASRAFLVYDHNSNTPNGSDSQAETFAKDVWKRYFVNFENGSDPTFNRPEFGGREIFVGSIVDFQEEFSFGFPFSSMDTMDMKSESFLGREPSRATCLERTCAAMGDVGVGQCQQHMTLVDNGC